MKKSLIVLVIPIAVMAMSVFSAAPVQASTSCFTFTRNLGLKVVPALSSTEASELTADLVAQGLWNSGTAITSYTTAVSNAVKTFQEKYASSILAPNGMTAGNGYFGDYTRFKMNSLYGCPATASSATTNTASSASVQCPANYTCTPIAQTTAPVCPVGYTCTLRTSAGTANTSTNTNTNSTLANINTNNTSSNTGNGTSLLSQLNANSASNNTANGTSLLSQLTQNGSNSSSANTSLTGSTNAMGTTNTANSNSLVTSLSAVSTANTTGTTNTTQTSTTVTTVDSGYFDYVCSAVGVDPIQVCNKDAGTSITLPAHNYGLYVETDPNALMTPYMAGTLTVPAGWTPNRSAPAANTLFDPDTWILNPSGQYYGFPCQYAGCIIPNGQNQTTVAKIIASIVGKSCSNEISFETAQAQASLYQGGLSSLINPSTLHLKAAEGTVEYSDFYEVGPFWPQTASLNAPANPEVFDLCLDSNYVSNIPAGFDKAKIIALNTPKTQAIIVPIGPTMSSSDYTISATYNVNVPYGRCTYNCGSDQTVHKPAGYQQATVSIIQFSSNNNNKYGVTPEEILFRLLSIGYRPADVDEITAIQPQAGDGIHYLGSAGMFEGVTNSKCIGTICAEVSLVNDPNVPAPMIYPGDKIAAVKL